MIYKMIVSRNEMQEQAEKEIGPIWAYDSNVSKIEYPGIKKGWFDRIDVTQITFTDDWPEITFYYNSEVSDEESAYLFNINAWPIIHEEVKNAFEEMVVKGVQYLPVKLFDISGGTYNHHYYYMNVLNYVEAFDLEKSKYTYTEKFQAYSFFPSEAVMDMSACKDNDIFHATKAKGSIFVSQRVKDLFEKKNWFGYSFYQMRDNNRE